jgi:hypothetical protein
MRAVLIIAVITIMLVLKPDGLSAIGRIMP